MTPVIGASGLRFGDAREGGKRVERLRKVLSRAVGLNVRLKRINAYWGGQDVRGEGAFGGSLLGD